MWIARDKSEELYLYQDNPKRKGIVFTSQFDCHRLPDMLFPDLQWEDEPLAVDITARRIK